MSIYKEYQKQPSIPRQCMHYSEKDGHRCRARAMHNNIMCFQHRADDIPPVLQNDPFEIVTLHDRASIQNTVTEIAARLARNHMDFKRAALLLQSCQIASSNLTAHHREAVYAAANAATANQAVPDAAASLPTSSPELDPNPDPELLKQELDYRDSVGLDHGNLAPIPPRNHTEQTVTDNVERAPDNVITLQATAQLTAYRSKLSARDPQSHSSAAPKPGNWQPTGHWPLATGNRAARERGAHAYNAATS